MTNETNKDENQYAHAYIQLLHLQCHALLMVNRGIIEVLKNTNDLTPEEIQFWTDCAMENNNTVELNSEKGILLVALAEAAKKAANLQASFEFLQSQTLLNQTRAANAHLN